MQVVVLEKGAYEKAGELAGTEYEGMATMYERGGPLLCTEDAGAIFPSIATESLLHLWE